MRKAVTRDEEDLVAGEKPEVYEVEDGDIVAQVEEEVVPGAFLVLIEAQGDQIEPLNRV